jgi:hypothetical protein
MWPSPRYLPPSLSPRPTSLRLAPRRCISPQARKEASCRGDAARPTTSTTAICASRAARSNPAEPRLIAVPRRLTHCLLHAVCAGAPAIKLCWAAQLAPCLPDAPLLACCVPRVQGHGHAVCPCAGRHAGAGGCSPGGGGGAGRHTPRGTQAERAQHEGKQARQQQQQQQAKQQQQLQAKKQDQTQHACIAVY